ncbi:TetR family transcriptional regulator [Solibacillus sp. FSL K6-1126]|uniref:TetR family transcriptional regulator n=1 Tax=Solibacillus sp. FSL K6-1126 TaxID=2921463 RepID=UPI0030FB8AC4
MNFYKILFQPSKKTIPLHKQLSLDSTVLIGKNEYSFGIQYSPESYNSWLMDEKIFGVFVQNSIKQLLMTNYKFLNLINRQDEFNLKVVDCKLENTDIDYFLQGEKINPETLNFILEDTDYRILQVYFRSRDRHMITLKSNGVLGIDNGLSEEEISDIKKLIDFLGFGPVVLV